MDFFFFRVLSDNTSNGFVRLSLIGKIYCFEEINSAIFLFASSCFEATVTGLLSAIATVTGSGVGAGIASVTDAILTSMESSTGTSEGISFFSAGISMAIFALHVMNDKQPELLPKTRGSLG